MTMPLFIVPIVEGDGDTEAVPLLLRRILYEICQRYEWRVGKPIRAGGLYSFKNKLDRYLGYALQGECDAILVLLDSEDQCPKEEACRLAEQVRTYSPLKPVAIVLAHQEYEAWFLADAESLAGEFGLPEDLRSEEDPERIRGAKEWLSNRMPRGSTYKPTFHQARMTERLNLDRVQQRSRSFHRLVNAVRQLIESPSPGVTPDRCSDSGGMSTVRETLSSPIQEAR